MRRNMHAWIGTRMEVQNNKITVQPSLIEDGQSAVV
jgi:hypothetical protein